MKKLFIAFLLFISHYSLLIAQSSWLPYSTGTPRGLTDVYFVNANTGWAVGDSTVVKSTNGGINWVRQICFYNGTSTPLYSVRFLNDNTGYTAGGFSNGGYTFTNYIFKTTNGGMNWILVFNQPNFNYGTINKIYPVTENLIFISQAGVVELNSLGGLYKSTDGGLNFSFCISNGCCNSFHFINENTGWTTFYSFSDFGFNTISASLIRL